MIAHQNPPTDPVISEELFGNLLTDYVEGKRTIAQLAARHGLAISALLEIFDLPEFTAALERMERHANRRSEFRSAAAADAALDACERLLTLNGHPALQHKAAATILRFAAQRRRAERTTRSKNENARGSDAAPNEHVSPGRSARALPTHPDPLAARLSDRGLSAPPQRAESSAMSPPSPN